MAVYGYRISIYVTYPCGYGYLAFAAFAAETAANLSMWIWIFECYSASLNIIRRSTGGRTVKREFDVYYVSDNYAKYVVSMNDLDMSRHGIQHLNDFWK